MNPGCNPMCPGCNLCILQARWMARQHLVGQGLAPANWGVSGGEGISEGVHEAIAAQRQWLCAQELLAATPSALDELLRSATPLRLSPMVARFPPSLFSPHADEEVVEVDLIALNGADPLSVVLADDRRAAPAERLHLNRGPSSLHAEAEAEESRGFRGSAEADESLTRADVTQQREAAPTGGAELPPPPQRRRRCSRHASAPLHLRAAPPAAADRAAAATHLTAATCADGADGRSGAPGGGAEGSWRDGDQSSALDCAFSAPLLALSQTPDPPTRQSGLANPESWSPPPTL